MLVLRRLKAHTLYCRCGILTLLIRHPPDFYDEFKAR